MTDGWDMDFDEFWSLNGLELHRRLYMQPFPFPERCQEFAVSPEHRCILSEGHRGQHEDGRASDLPDRPCCRWTGPWTPPSEQQRREILPVVFW